ncbi:MAG: J domain-containing protein [Solirubrobacterales bacterium]|nr:J domain-containing protein [Solirubrobacterales bacterium]
MDPLATLGLGAFATPQEVAAAYRTLAKRWHPDRAGSGPEAARRMAEINAAYDLLREGRPGGGPDLRGDRARQEAARSRDVWGADAEPAPTGTRDARAARRPAGHWLPEAVRRSLGRELLLALEPQEPVELVTPAATWKSPRALLVTTDRRLLWLLDDAISHRVHSLRWRDVGRVQHRSPRRLRRTATVRVETTLGRKLEWAQLPPDTALDIAAWITARAGLAAGEDAAPAPG